MKKIVLPGIVIGIAMLVIGLVVDFALKFLQPALTAEYNNAALFRPWSDPRMSLYFVYAFIVGLIMAWVWQHVKGVLHAEPSCTGHVCVCKCSRGTKFGLIFWVIWLPGMIITYGSFQISFAIVTAWTISMLVQAIVAGKILEKLEKN